MDAVEKAGKSDPEAILGIYVAYDPDDELAGEAQLYSVDIVVVYKADIERAPEIAQAAAESIRNRFELKFKVFRNESLTWNKVLLSSCSIASDEEFTLRDAMTFSLWKLEHLSFRQDPPAETPNLR